MPKRVITVIRGGGAGAGFLDINEYLNKLDLLI
jgi:hypothetical protein